MYMYIIYISIHTYIYIYRYDIYIDDLPIKQKWRFSMAMLPEGLHVPMQDYKVLEQGKAICHVQRLGDGTPTGTAC